MTEPMSVLHLTGKDPSTGQIKTFDFEIVDEVARRQKADKADTVQETTLSRGRKEGTEVGEGSVAFGTDVEASGEGSHAEGNGTVANAPYMYAFGEYNTPAEVLPEWVAETEYAAGDKVIYDGKAYVCDTANSDAEFDPTKWTETEMPEAPVFVIGNGTSENSRGDAFAVERDGDVKAGGDLYTNYDPATGTGKKVATEDYVGDLIGDVVSMEYAVADELPATGEVGTIYLIPNGETSGTDTHDEYIWVPATESFEKIGNTKVDLSDYALKTDTVLNTTLSMGRKAGTTVGARSTALGYDVTASGDLSFATGTATTASGPVSYAVGGGTTASGNYSHAEGYGSQATGNDSHAEGSITTASGDGSHAEGGNTTASGGHSHAEGGGTTASGGYSHAEGQGTQASGDQSHAEGGGTQAIGDYSHAEGFDSQASGPQSHAEGNNTTASEAGSHAEGASTTASGLQSHAEGSGSRATSAQSHAEGGGTLASGPQSHAEGGGSQATAGQSHAEGQGAHATGAGAHAEGAGTTASGDQAHAEGGGSQATGRASHAEGNGARAIGDISHAEGSSTTASGQQSHAEGAATTASANQSHAEGMNTIANGVNMHAQGKYNKPDDATYLDWVASKSYAVGDKVTYNGDGFTCKTANSDDKFYGNKWTRESSNGGEIAFVIGNGTANNARSNALTVNWDGTQKIAGDLYTNYNFDTNTGNKVATEAYVTEAIAEAGGGSDEYALKTDTVLNTTLSMGRKANTTVGQNSVALGSDVEASGPQSHAEGGSTTATGGNSHAEGGYTQATGSDSHAEGQNTIASGGESHAEGSQTTASGGIAHAEGYNTTASGNSSHAEGGNTTASNVNSHAEGNYTQATAASSHAEGNYTQATAASSHAEGHYTIANGVAMHAQGKYNKPDDAVWPDWEYGQSYAVGDKVTYQGVGYTCKTANSDDRFTSSNWTQVYSNGDIAFVIGNGANSDNRSNAFLVKWNGTTTAAGDVYANNTKKLATEEYVNNAVAGGGGSDEYALKTDTVLETTLSMGRKAETVVGENSTALGQNVTASGMASHAEGSVTTANGNQSHAEGAGTQATGGQSHAEGAGSQATGDQSHAEGMSTTASGHQSHAEGAGARATGITSHAEGNGTLASGDGSHAEGIGTIANGIHMHAQGKYNKPDDTVWPDWEASRSYAVGDKVTYQGKGYTCKTANSDATFDSNKWTYNNTNGGEIAFVIGNGTNNARSNAFAVKWDGTLIMRDVSNGAYYKVYIDGGVLKTEAVV